MAVMPTCFFCYAWCENDRYNYLKFIKNYIETRSQGRIEVILDRESYKPNDDFEEKERDINSYDLIVVCNSTELKRVHDNPEKFAERRILKELEIIKRRLSVNKESVFSFLVEGDDSVILPIFKNRNTKHLDDFTFFQKYDPNVQLKIAVRQEREFYDFIDRIIYLTKVNNLNRSPDYRDARQALNNLLNLTNKSNLPPACLVHTDIYDKITEQDGIVYFVVGRKGAGKSTLIHNFINQVSTGQYKQALPISAESFKHEFAYELLYIKHEQDSALFHPLSTFEFFWGVFIVIHCIVTVGCEIEVGGISSSDKRFSAFNGVCKKLKDLLSMKDTAEEYKNFTSTDSVIDQLFTFCVDIVDQQFNEPEASCGSNPTVYPAFTAHMNVDDILIRIFGKQEITAFADGLEECKKRIVISIDGFDDHSEQFRNKTMKYAVDSEIYKKRITFDEVFFRSLLNVAHKIKENQYKTKVFKIFGNCIDFCIVLPNDRYSLIMDNDRDITKKKFVALMWDAYELLEMVVKRLEYLGHFMRPEIKISDSITSPFDKYQKLIEAFPNLPSKVGINIRGEEKKVSLFNYLLRYSFWRPRDIISNLNSVMSAVIEVNKGNNKIIVLKPGEKLTSLEIRTLTKSNIEQIYKAEFIKEYKHVYDNLSDIFDHFRGRAVAYTLPEFKNEINSLHISTVFASKIVTFDDKMRTLYRLGAIGILYPKNSNVEYLSKTCFIFNAGIIPLEDLLDGKKTNNVKIIFNPLIAHCQDMVWNISDVIGNWTEEEINNMHRLHSAIQGL